MCSFSGEREDIQAASERLACRCLTVEVTVSTPRSLEQEKSFHMVTSIVDEIKSTMYTDIQQARDKLQVLSNSCSSESEGNVDMKFLSMLIACAADDQKKTRKRIQHLLTLATNVLANETEKDST